MDEAAAPLDWRIAKLTDREKEIVSLICDGRSTKEIAIDVASSLKTIESHRRNVLTKLGFHSVAQLTKYAILKGLTSPEP
jgi:NarL family two-component system response regulator LiaR